MAESIPPPNPFFSGAPLRYYWFSLYPFAVEYRLLSASLFDIWKCNLSWLAFAFIPFFWLFCRSASGSRKAAIWAVAFAFVLPSYEIFALLYEIPALAMEKSAITAWMSSVLQRDPDMLAGIVTSYSDQLFMEDFLYLPQNAVALLLVLSGVFFMRQNRNWLGLFTLSALAGVNTFFVLPVFPACILCSYRRFGARRALLDGSVLVTYAAVWLALCNIIDSRWAVPLALTAAVITGATRLWGDAEPVGWNERVEAGVLRRWAFILVALVGALILLRPLLNLPILVLNYGPAFVLGIGFLLFLLRKHAALSLTGGTPVLLFLLATCSIYLAVSLALLLPYTGFVPEWLARPFDMLGREVNLFNFYHKVGKLMRLSWAVWAGLSLAMLSAARPWSRLRPWLRAALWAALVPASLTSIVRPLTYLSDAPHPDYPAVRYLMAEGAGMATTVLLEDFRSSRLLQLVPVAAYYYAHWSGGHPGLTHAVGNWADQYLPRSDRQRSPLREHANLVFFSDEATPEHRRKIVEENRIDYILTTRPYDFDHFADRVLTGPSCFLYRARKSR
ncbi:MAG: DUF4175 domain-containing protein [Acidobacteria bacterium]|nr:DUF4175 domain-containing protein [Acidobacteriota bacterium]